MLTLVGAQVECLWDEVLPVEVRELPEDLARLDRVLVDELLLWPIAQAWEGDFAGAGTTVDPDGHVRAVDGRQAAHWLGIRDAGAGGVGLVASAAVLFDRDRSTGAGRVDGAHARASAGPEVVAEITRMVIEKAQRETRFVGRSQAVAAPSERVSGFADERREVWICRGVTIWPRL
jgi:hypothetical protein